MLLTYGIAGITAISMASTSGAGLLVMGCFARAAAGKLLTCYRCMGACESLVFRGLFLLFFTFFLIQYFAANLKGVTCDRCEKCDVALSDV